MTSAVPSPTHTPLFVGNGADADCPRHGEMTYRDLRLVVVEGVVYGIRDEVALYYCPECCLDLFALAGDSNPDPEDAMLLLWKQYLEDAWSEALRPMFVELGTGELKRQDDEVIVQFDHEIADAQIPTHLRRDDRMQYRC